MKPNKDKERLLTTILMMTGPFTADCRFGHKPGALTGPHWGNPVEGDLVRCNSLREPHAWFWSWLVEVRGYSDFLLRELGSERLCNMSNEGLVALHGYWPDRMLEGHQYTFHQKVYKAFGALDDYGTRYAGVEWADRHSKVATIGIRASSLFGRRKHEEGKRWCVKPVLFQFEHNSRTTIKSIVAEIEKHALTRDEWEDRFVQVDGGSGSLTMPFTAMDAT